MQPIFNKKEYLGKYTKPKPNERFLIEISNPEFQLAYKNEILKKCLDEEDLEYLIQS